MNKLRGYNYCIIERFPIEGGEGFRFIQSYDRLEDAEDVLGCLEKHNYNFTCYAIMLSPVWWDISPEEYVEEEWERDECEDNTPTEGLSSLDLDTLKKE
jgi:hypothetical protein